MTTNLYNLHKQEIATLDEVDMYNTQKYYRYKTVDFLYKRNDTTDRLVIAFHGSICKMNGSRQQTPIFRLYNYKYNLLCISDKMLELYPQLNIAWYTSDKSSGIFDTYVEIIQAHLEKFSNVIFYGASAGGFPALLFSAYFKNKVLIVNSQLYIKKWQNVFKNIIDAVNKSEFEMTDCDCEKIIEKYGPPCIAYIFCNRNDVSNYKYHYIPFQKFIQRKKLEHNFNFIDFIGRDPIPPETHHGIQYPGDEKLAENLEKIFLAHQ